MEPNEEVTTPSEETTADVEVAAQPPADRDDMLEAKDAEVMSDETVAPPELQAPPAPLWHYLDPKMTLSASTEVLVRMLAFSQSLNGLGVSEMVYQKLPDDVRMLFTSASTTEFNPAEQL